MPRLTPLAVSLALVAGLISALPASAADFAKQEDAIKYRQSAFIVMAQHFGRLGAMATGHAPYDATAAAANMNIVTQMVKLPWAGFQPGSEGGKSKPEIWKDPAKFKELQDKFLDNAAKLDAAAKTGKLDDLKAAFGPTGKSCKNCHDEFRKK
ncbi:MAG: cytochrome c [Burkholderiaceae bacterium]|jgi:cytochrome c556|nr:cytochrome c [Burkholderiaceae bacterium]